MYLRIEELLLIKALLYRRITRKFLNELIKVKSTKVTKVDKIRQLKWENLFATLKAIKTVI